MSLLLVVAVTFQLAVASRLEVFGVQGDLMLLVAVAAGLAAGPDRGATLGFAAGITFDLLLQSPFGLSALTYALVAYLVGSPAGLRAAGHLVDPGDHRGRGERARCHPVRRVRHGGRRSTSSHFSLLRIALVVGTLNAIAAPVVLRARALGHGHRRQRPSPRVMR